MMRYRFRLEQVLRVRRAEEEVARQALQMANRRVQSAEATRRLHAERYARRGHAVGPMPLDAFHQERSSSTLAAEALASAAARLDEARTDAAAHRERWVLAAQRVQALERLDERRRQEHAAEENVQEIATVDDLVAARWVSPLELAKQEAGR